MSTFTPRSSQDLNRLCPNAHFSMSQLANTHDASYLFSGQNQYAVVNSPFQSSPGHYASTYGHSTPFYDAEPGHLMTPMYSHKLSVKKESGSSLRENSFQDVYSNSRNQNVPRNPPMHGFVPLQDRYHAPETESQETRIEWPMKSEPVDPPLEGFPTVADFDNVIEG